MNNRVFLMILACLAFYLLWLNLGKQFGFIPEPEEPTPGQVEEQTQPVDKGTGQETDGPRVATAADGEESAQAPLVQEDASPEERRLPSTEVTLANDNMTVSLDNRGAVIKSVELKKFVGSQKEGDPIVLVASRRYRPGEVVFVDGTSTADWMFHVERLDERTVILSQTRANLTIEKRFVLGTSYDINVDVSVKRHGQDAPFRLILAQGLRPVEEGDSKGKSFFNAAAVNPKLLMVAWSKNGHQDDQAAGKVQTLEFSRHPVDGTLDWVGVADTYFANVFVPTSQFAEFWTKKVAVPTVDESQKATDLPVVALSSDRDISGTFYMGPKAETDLAPIDTRLTNLVSYGWAGLLSKWMYKLLKAFYSVLGNWGWAIIGVTILIRLVLVPISMPSIKSSFKMRQIQPKIDALRKKYPGKDMESRQKLSQETFKLYKEEGVNPFSSCITILPQLPIFIAYFSLLRTSISLRQSDWMFWVNDLSAKDPTFILPILMGATMYLSQLTMPMPGDPAQQKMMKLMPLFLTLMFLTMPSGLMLYMITSNLFQLGQSYFMKWRYRDL